MWGINIKIIMNPNLKNYTTSISAEKSIMEIEKMLLDFGATNFGKKAENGIFTGLFFSIDVQGKNVPFKLPIDIKAIATYLANQKTGIRKTYTPEDCYEQAYKVGWRIMKDWVFSQLSIIASGMVNIEDVFLGYMLIENNLTLSEGIREGRYKNLLPEYKGD